jgi:hypothetical protein
MPPAISFRFSRIDINMKRSVSQLVYIKIDYAWLSTSVTKVVIRSADSGDHLIFRRKHVKDGRSATRLA